MIVGLLIFGVAFSSGSFFSVLGAIIAILGAAALAFGMSETRKWEDLDLIIPEWPLVLGSTRPATLQRHAKRSVRDRTITVTGELICREKVTYQQGTTTTVDKHTVYRSAIDVTGAVKDDVFTAELPLPIPVNSGGPTMRKDNNEIEWLLQLNLNEISPMMQRLTFELDVVAILHPSIRMGDVQDAPRGES